MLRLLVGDGMRSPETPLQLEIVSEDWRVTPALAKLLATLARRQLEWEKQHHLADRRGEHAA
jgi:hypothetical protein